MPASGSCRRARGRHGGPPRGHGRSQHGDWDGAPGCAAQARSLSARLEPLALADAEAYAEALEALAEGDGAAATSALDRAAELPLAIADAASAVAELAAEALEHCAVHVRGETLAAVALARGATEGGRHGSSRSTSRRAPTTSARGEQPPHALAQPTPGTRAVAR